MSGLDDISVLRAACSAAYAALPPGQIREQVAAALRATRPAEPEPAPARPSNPAAAGIFAARRGRAHFVAARELLAGANDKSGRVP